MSIRRLIAPVMTALLILSACGGDDPQPAADERPSAIDDGLTRLWIEPELVDCEGVGPQTCMQVAESADGPTELFYDGIEGFEHEAGTAYVVDVRIETVDDPPADGSSLRYVLVEVVSAS